MSIRDKAVPAPGTQPAGLVHRARTIAFGLVAALPLLTTAVGCSSTSAGEGAADGSVMTADAQSDVGGDASSALCAAAGGHCVGFGGGPCTLVGPGNACNPDQPGPGGSFCCAVAPDAGTCKDVQASSYDESCKVDTDRVAISTRSCFLCAFNCTNAAINKGALARYMSDVANATANISGQHLACSGDCGLQFPCCVAGRCQWSPCSAPVPDAGAEADAGSDAAMDADACAPSGCVASCVTGAHNVSHMVDGCLVWQCCVPDDAAAD